MSKKLLIAAVIVFLIGVFVVRKKPTLPKVPSIVNTIQTKTSIPTPRILRQTTAEEILNKASESADIKSEAIAYAVNEKLGILSPSPTPHVLLIPTIPNSLTPTPDKLFATDSAVFNLVRLHNAGKNVLPNGVVTSSPSYTCFVDIRSKNGDGQFKSPIVLTFTWIIGGKRFEMGTYEVNKTGTWGMTFYNPMYDATMEPELTKVADIQLEISTDKNSKRTFAYKQKVDTSKPSTYAIAVTTLSNRSKPDVIDRKSTVGSVVTVTNSKEEKVATVKTTGTVDIIRNLPADTYKLIAEYKGMKSEPKKVTVGTSEENQYEYVLLVLPLTPDKVDDYKTRLYGTLESPYTQYYDQSGMKGQAVELHRVDRTGSYMVAKTMTDAWGTFVFDNVPGDASYVIDYTPIQGWTRDGDISTNTFNITSTEEKSVTVQVKKDFTMP